MKDAPNLKDALLVTVDLEDRGPDLRGSPAAVIKKLIRNGGTQKTLNRQLIGHKCGHITR